MAEPSKFAIPIEQLEREVHVPIDELVESQPQHEAAHEMHFVDTVIGAETKTR